MVDELPDTKAARVDWVIRAPDNAEMKRRYDIWAKDYDADVGSAEDYLAPLETARIAKGVLDQSALIMDAGAGTGLVGEALKEQGFNNLVAVDYSAQMLDIARRKQVYTELHTCDLSVQTEFETDRFDAVITCGTTSQMPSNSLREFVRIVRPGGKIIFAAVPELWVECGYAAVFSEMRSAGHLDVVSRGEPFQMMPTTEPDFICEVWVMNVN